MDFSQEVWLTIWAYLLLAVPVLLASLIMGGILVRSYKRSAPRHVAIDSDSLQGVSWSLARTFPPLRRFAQPWQLGEILFIFLLWMLWQGLAYWILEQLLGKPTDDYDKSLRAISSNLLAFPFYVSSWLVMLRLSSGTRLYQLGCHGHRWKENIFLGLVACILGTPLVYLLNLLVSFLFLLWTGEAPPQHQLVHLTQGYQPFLEWSVILSSALIVAPLAEELLFRGIIQRWANGRSWHSFLVMLGAVGFGMIFNEDFSFEIVGFWLVLVPGFILGPHLIPTGPEDRSMKRGALSNREPDSSNENEEEIPLPDNSQPLPRWQRVSLSILHFLDPTVQDSHANVVRGIYSTAVFFACIHPWPTPIPLLVLGLLLGWLAYRTQSLVAPMLLHFLFNVLACLMIALAQLVPEFQGVLQQ